MLTGKRDAFGHLLYDFQNGAEAHEVIERDDGMTIAESLDPYDTDDADHRQYHKRNRARGRMAGQLRLRVRYKRYATPWFDYLLASRSEMKRLTVGTPREVATFVDSQGPAYVAVLAKRGDR